MLVMLVPPTVEYDQQTCFYVLCCYMSECLSVTSADQLLKQLVVRYVVFTLTQASVC